MTSESLDLPPFIASQGLQLLVELQRPEQYLRAEFFRTARPAGPAFDSAATADVWRAVGRRDVVQNGVHDADGSHVDLSRMVLTTDAGLGKTTNRRWLLAELNHPGADRLAFLVDVARLPPALDDLLTVALLPQLRQAEGNELAQLPDRLALQVLQGEWEKGRLVLLLDALDQAPPDGPAIETLLALLRDPRWKRCRVVLCGRPHALQQHWARLFDPQHQFGWRFLQLDQFDEGQQRAFLGSDRRGENRYERVPAEARQLLTSPRVLEYLRRLTARELGAVRRAADVYWQAVNHMLKEGMKNSAKARQIGLARDERPPDKVQRRSLQAALRLLGAMAFEMTAGAGSGTANFDRIGPGELAAFKQRLFARLSPGATTGDPRDVERDMDCLAALNDILLQGLFEPDVEGLDQILWRNRSLQEFFTAYWMAQHTTEDDARQLADWVYAPTAPQTEEYYWAWRFACEMPAAARHPDAWVRGLSPVYRPGDGTPEGTRRSCEMIYRAWDTLRQLADQGQASAVRVRSAFLGEFESEILSGGRGDDARRRAEQLRDSLLSVPAGQFRMGSPPEKQGATEEIRAQVKEFVERPGEPEQRAEELAKQWTFVPGRQGQEQREELVAWWTRIFQDRDVEAVLAWWYPSDETPEQPDQTVDAFLLSRWPTINAWYRLFAPGHGQTQSYFQEPYGRISPDPDCPAIFVSWYDAWAFCVWAHWDGRSCRLPAECEWEYAAKAGTPWDRRYWWGDEFDPARCNAERRIGRTTPPSADHQNPWGFQDILGNVWEWCEDEYRRAYSRTGESDSSARVLRGGAWDHYTVYVRSAVRSNGRPAYAEDVSGFRVARAK